MTLTAQPLAIPSEHTQDALQALSDTHEANLADGNLDRNAKSRAVIVLADGSQVRCDVKDLSIDGAYLVRRVLDNQKSPVQTGDTIKVFLFHPGNPLLESVTLGARIIRTEAADGPGLAIRFKPVDGREMHGEQLEWTTEVPEPVIPEAFSASAMSAPEPSPRTTAGTTLVMTSARVARPLFWTAVVGLNVAAFMILSQWLNAVL